LLRTYVGSLETFIDESDFKDEYHRRYDEVLGMGKKNKNKYLAAVKNSFIKGRRQSIDNISSLKAKRQSLPPKLNLQGILYSHL
jgi:hypothetical protein